MKKIGFSARFVLIYFICIVSFLCLFSSGMLESEDGWLYLTVARNIYYHHQIAPAPNEYNAGKNVNMNSTLGSDGKWHAHGGVGYSFSMVPAVFFSDLLHRHYGSTPPVHFPLESDWSVQFFASFTNTFFCALLSVALLFYGRALGMTKKSSILLSLATIFTTNLWPLSKFSFPHMMFTTFLVLSFLSVKLFWNTKKKYFLLLALMSYCIVFISYNEAYFIPIIPLIVYFLLLAPKHLRKKYLSIITVFGAIVVLFRAKLFTGMLGLLKPNPKILFEGIWGYLLSPGKSMFLYSPLLILLPIFWTKLKKTLWAERISIFLMTTMFMFFYGSSKLYKNVPGSIYPIWHGGMDWGPRYIGVLIPFLMLLVIDIVQKLSIKQKKFIVIPLAIYGILIQLIGVSVPYILQYRDIPYNIFIGAAEMPVYDYASFIPRFTPLYTMAREAYRMTTEFPSTIMHGKYDVRFYDGFEMPLWTGIGVFRGFRSEGHISFKANKSEPYENLNLSLYYDAEEKGSTSSANVDMILNSNPVSTFAMKAFEDKDLAIQIKPSLLGEKINYLDLLASKAASKSGVLYIKSMELNSQKVNLSSIDYPDVSSMGYKTTPIPYQYYGNRMNTMWNLWYMRAGVNERSFDFWWIKNLYYWDRPRNFIWMLFGINLLLVIGSSYMLIKQIANMK